MTDCGFTLCSFTAISYAPQKLLPMAAKPAPIGKPTWNMSIPSPIAWIRKNTSMVCGSHSSQGILKEGRPNMKVPSMSSHFINNHKLCSSESCKVFQSYRRHDMSAR